MSGARTENIRVKTKENCWNIQPLLITFSTLVQASIPTAENAGAFSLTMPLGEGGLEKFFKIFTTLVRIPWERLHKLKKQPGVADDTSHPPFPSFT
jgi:hypothetical protein